jgi:hypothetical protein
MRSWVVAAALALALPASAAADYRVLDEAEPYEAMIAVAGGEVYAGATADEMKGLNAYGLDGSTRTLIPLGREGVAAVAASPQALVAATSRGPWFGPPMGPLSLIPDDVTGLAVTGSTVLTLEGKPSSAAIVARDLATGAVPKLVARPGKDPTDLKAAGPYVSVVVNHEARDSTFIVYEIATGREVYRIANVRDDGYDLGPDARIVLVRGTRGRAPIQTATPSEPQLRTIARLRVMPYIDLAGNRMALARRGAVSRMLLLGLDGTQEQVSGPIGGVTSLAYDGTTLAFIAGHCLYGGTGPGGPATNDGCFDSAPASHRWRLRGRSVVVRVTCRVPPGARCRGVLKLDYGDRGTLARRRLNLQPGEYTVRLRVPRRHLAKARSSAAYVYVD